MGEVGRFWGAETASNVTLLLLRKIYRTAVEGLKHGSVAKIYEGAARFLRCDKCGS